MLTDILLSLSTPLISSPQSLIYQSSDWYQYIYQSINLLTGTCISISIGISISINLSIFWLIHISVYLSVFWMVSVYLSVFWMVSVYLSVFWMVSVYLSVFWLVSVYTVKRLGLLFSLHLSFYLKYSFKFYRWRRGGACCYVLMNLTVSDTQVSFKACGSCLSFDLLMDKILISNFNLKTGAS